MEINQFHSGTAVGDAVTNLMLELRGLLIKRGYKSNIYAQHIAPGLEKEIRNIESYNGNPKNILFVHHSMGFDLFDKIISLPDKKALIYHNITPEKFFDDLYTKKYIRLGLNQAKNYKNFLDYFIADSNYNRKCLIEMGYRNVDVMPIQLSLNRFDYVVSDSNIKQQYKETTNILFVGRIAPNKRQDDVIRAFSVYRKHFNPNAKLLLVGDTGFTAYVESLKNLVRQLDIEDRVDFFGKVSEEELKAAYEVSKLFLCMSEHEGFGVPLLEAMIFGMPVITYNSSAISETMGGAGILLNEKDEVITGALINEIIEDKALYDAIVKKEKERIEKFKRSDTEKILFNIIDNIKSNSRKTTVQMQGPFETSYSLAIVNRKLIEAIDNKNYYDASIYCTEGPGDYEPSPEDLKDKPQAKGLWEKSKDITFPDITIRNMYPPRVSDADGGLNFQAFGWEETIVPKEYIDSFNKYLDGIGTMSDFVTEILIDSGLRIPVKTMGVGVFLANNFDDLSPYKLKTKKKTKFLHISSAFPRKGVDILLEAYFEAFTKADDVCLVLKSFPNIHNTVNAQLEELNKKYKNAPEVEFINEDFQEGDLYGLYKACDCYVQVSRGEGFGLPVAEAMLARLPVIVSPNTGLADFCNQDTALLVDYVMEMADTHLTARNSYWAEPNKETLKELLKQFYEDKEYLKTDEKVKNAYELISNYFSWEAVAERWHDFIEEVYDMKEKPKVAMITSWNTKCGIAEYTRLLVESIFNRVDYKIYPNYGEALIKKDEDFVAQRHWESVFSGNLDRLTDEFLNYSDCNVLHFQFNFGFFNLQQFADLVRKTHNKKKIIITFHKTKDADVLGEIVSLESIKDELNMCERIIVHQKEDRDILEGFGVLSKKIIIIPLGQVEYKNRTKEEVLEKLDFGRSLVLGSYGFLLPNKGVYENIEALSIIKKAYPDVLYLACCSLHSAVESKKYLERCNKLVEKLDLKNNVVFITDYLDNDESMVILQACDILLMTYLPSTESASGAVRFCVAAKRPLVTTRQDIFKEFENCSYQIEKTDKKLIAEAVIELKKNPEKCKTILKEINKKIDETSWKKVSKMTYDLYKEIDN